MNSEKLNNAYVKFNEIGEELSKYSRYSHEALLTKFINERLSQTLNQYNIELEKTTSFLSAQSGMRVLKAIAKKRKQQDKEIIETYFIEDIKND